jgi:uncharacterized Zn finger protein (UPF0148 family)
MKQGLCKTCKVRWVSDKDFGKLGKTRCPMCGELLHRTSALSAADIHIHPEASVEYQEEVKNRFRQKKRIYPGYNY